MLSPRDGGLVPPLRPQGWPADLLPYSLLASSPTCQPSLAPTLGDCPAEENLLTPLQLWAPIGLDQEGRWCPLHPPIFLSPEQFAPAETTHLVTRLPTAGPSSGLLGAFCFTGHPWSPCSRSPSGRGTPPCPGFSSTSPTAPSLLRFFFVPLLPN